jgi:hypothetical protein
MKPQFNTSRQLKSGRDNSRPVAFRRNLLATDHSYHPASSDLRTTNRQLNRASSRVSPSIRDLSKQFLGAESTRSYAIEASLFAIIVGISAWPIFTMAQAMAQLR